MRVCKEGTQETHMACKQSHDRIVKLPMSRTYLLERGLAQQLHAGIPRSLCNMRTRAAIDAAALAEAVAGFKKKI